MLPDLPGLSLVVAQTALMQMDADVIHLERNNQSECWQAQHYWLDSCPSEKVGMVSPHLLDRFALRLTWHDTTIQSDQQARIEQLQQTLTNTNNSPLTSSILEPTLIARLQTAQACQPALTIATAAYRAMLEYFPSETGDAPIFHRREIALARYAYTLAQLDQAEVLMIKHVEQAAYLMGLHKITQTEEINPVTSIAPPEVYNPAAWIEQALDQPIQQEQKEVGVPDTTLSPVLQSVITPEMPYHEDEAPVLREEASLRIPFASHRHGRTDRGTIIGVEQSNSFQDLALVSTLLQALHFQYIRQAAHPHPERLPKKLRITQHDLRRYRRAPIPTHLLLLLFDYTCMENCNWQESLLPYLSEAYVHRAQIAIAKVGAQNARHELQADMINARSILVPRINTALATRSGTATPLAHGLQLAQQTIQRSLQHGRNTVREITFVVISDGRGNVPLHISLSPQPIIHILTREGITDALLIAQNIQNIKHVQTILLDPQPDAYPQLPHKLAEALGATVIPIQPYHTDETEEVL
jgi:magnesium chelatase subunit D